MNVATITIPRETAAGDQLSAKVDGEKIKLTLRDKNSQEASYGLGRHEALTLVVAIGKLANDLPSERAAPVDQRAPVLRVKDPSFRIGLNREGGVTLVIKPNAFPAMEFEFDVQVVSKLIEGLKRVASIPSLRSGAKH